MFLVKIQEVKTCSRTVLHSLRACVHRPLQKKLVVGKYLMRGKLTFCEDPYLLSLKIYSTFSNHVILIYVYFICVLNIFAQGSLASEYDLVIFS